MKLDLTRVLAKFYKYSGADESDEASADLCNELCTECADRAMALLEKRCAGEPDSAELEKYLPALECWAAAEAFYQLTLTDEASAPRSITADGVQITVGERSEKARALAEQKRIALQPIFGEGAFYFGIA